jgi:hypothetical protein
VVFAVKIRVLRRWAVLAACGLVVFATVNGSAAAYLLGGAACLVLVACLVLADSQAGFGPRRR